MATGKDFAFFLLSTYFRDPKLIGILDIRSKSTRSRARFGLYALEDDMTSGLIMVKKEKAASSLLLKRDHVDLTVKTPGSWKRIVEAIDLSMENLGAEEALRKLDSFS